MTVILASKDSIEESRTSQEANVAGVQGCERPAGWRNSLSEEDAARLSVRR